jgi:thymidylate synthase (FAD)
MIKATYIEHMGSDVSVVNSARVSFGKKSDSIGSYDIHMGNWAGEIPVLDNRDEKLIKYLAKHKHLSPFGHCFASFHVKAPVFVARQLVKHKFLRWNEISRRYVDDDPEFYTPSEWRGKSEDKKQGSSNEIVDKLYWSDLDTELSIEGHPVWHEEAECGVSEYTQYIYEDTLQLYNRMISNGICPEQARMVLPQSMMTEWYWSGSLDAFADMCRLRCAPDTQAETRMVASEISELMGQLYPSSWDALIGDGK